jgi:hypothetical protein
MAERVEKFRQLLQKELGLSVGPKDPILAEFLAQQELRQEMAAEHQRLLAAFEVALIKNQAIWSDQAKNLANQSLNAALGVAREKVAAFSEEASRRQAGMVRAAVEEGVQRLENALGQSRRIAWVSIGASIIALAAAGSILFVKLAGH